MHEQVDFQGMTALRWRAGDGATALVTLQGAHLVSWIPARGAECLYLSERSAFEPGRAIRGGIPVIFPQFADRGPLAQHGFARNRTWRFLGVSEARGAATASFGLESSEETRATWPHDFRLELAITIAEARLEAALRVMNPGDASFTFTAALHTYLRVADAARAELRGLSGCRYVNRGSDAVEVESRAAITAAEPIDRVYFATPAATRLADGARRFLIGQRGFTDTVVWNPGAERAARMPDMPAGGDRQMLCVEAAAIEPPVVLAPGADWTGVQSLEIA